MVVIDTTMPRKRDENREYTNAYGDDEFLAALESEERVAGTVTLADLVGCRSRHALTRLCELEEAAEIESKDVGRSLVGMLDDND